MKGSVMGLWEWEVGTAEVQGLQNRLTAHLRHIQGAMNGRNGDDRESVIEAHRKTYCCRHHSEVGIGDDVHRLCCSR